MGKKIIQSNIEKYGLIFRLIEPGDAAFILKLRSDPSLARFISKTSNSLNDQINWINNYKTREAEGKEYYFVTTTLDGQSLGTSRLSELEGDCFELGSWLFSREAPQGASILADIVTKEIGFDMLDFNFCKFNVRKENKSVLKYHLNFSPIIVDENDLDVYFNLSKENFYKNKNKFLKFYSNGN